MNRHLVLLLCLALITPSLSAQVPPRYIHWDDLSTLRGKNISITLPNQITVRGTPIAIEPDALVFQVKSTTDARQYPKGRLLVPRANLKSFELYPKMRYARRGAAYFLIAAGCFSGFIGTTVAYGFNNPAAAGIGIGVGAGIGIGGYLLVRNPSNHKPVTYIVTEVPLPGKATP